MTLRCIVLGDGRRVPLRAYVAGWRKALDLPPTVWVPKTPSGWGGTAGDAVREFRDGLHDRINRHLPWYGKGRKWEGDWQRETLQAALALNTPRLAIHWLPPHLKKRFWHRLSSAH